MHEEELRRRERIRKNAEISYGKAKMPPTMQMYADRKKQEIPKQQEEQFSFKPQIGPPFTAAMAKAKQEKFNKELAKKKERKKQLVAQSPKFQKRPQKILEKPGVDEGQRPVGLDMATLQMKRLAEKARKQALAGELEGSAKAPSSTGGFQKAVQQRRKELQARQAAEEKERKEREEREKRLSKKKPASQLLGVIKSDNSNLSLLKVTMRQVDALKKAGEDPKMYLTE